MQNTKKNLYKCNLSEFNLHNNKVFLRADLNVPLHNKTILDDFRLLAILPTINLILQKGGQIILATHLGRPEGKYQENLSTSILLPWFKQHGYSIKFAKNFEDAKRLHTPIVLLENLRFFFGEQYHDILFAQQLASLANFYVNDAFGLLHRHDTSITLLPKLFDTKHRSIGLLIEHELNALNRLISPQHPFVIIMGGGKITTKLPLLEYLIDVVDTILLCPALVFTFLKALNIEVGNSLVDVSALKNSLSLMKTVTTKKAHLIFPEDYRVFNKEKKIITVQADAIPSTARGISIGPKSLLQFARYLENAQTIFFNAAMGFSHEPETMIELEALLKLVAESPAFTVVGGGDSVSAARKFNLAQKIDFLSTGGGSTLAYLSGKLLPGLQAMQE